MKNKTSKTSDLTSSLSLFSTFLTLSWIVFLFPDIIGNFYHIAIAKILLIVGIFFISIFGDEKSKADYSDFGVGLGFIVICLAFFQNLPNVWYYRLPFFLFFGIFGLFGVYRSLFAKMRNIHTNRGDILNPEIKKYKINLYSIFQVALYIVEFLSAIVTILQFIGFKIV